MVNTKALQKQLFAAIAMVLVAVIAVSSSTYAWFAANTVVNATNMQVTATTSQSLVISNSALPTTSTATITVASTDNGATALIPTTHDSTYATNPKGLVYNTKPENVNAGTGLADNTIGDLVFASAENGNGANYYKDYTVYIAANGGEMTGQDITIDIMNNKVETLMGATSIDFYYKAGVTTTGAVAASNTFLGTLNLAELDPVTNDGSATLTTLTIEDITIPQANGNSAIAVTMRVYVDGALMKDDSTGTTFVKNTKVAEIGEGQTLGVSFTAAAHVNP